MLVKVFDVEPVDVNAGNGMVILRCDRQCSIMFFHLLSFDWWRYVGIVAVTLEPSTEEEHGTFSTHEVHSPCLTGMGSYHLLEKRV